MQTAAPRPAHDDLVAELRALNARFIQNYVTNDVESHDAMMHPDFICIGPKGTRQNRAFALCPIADVRNLLHCDWDWGSGL